MRTWSLPGAETILVIEGERQHMGPTSVIISLSRPSRATARLLAAVLACGMCGAGAHADGLLCASRDLVGKCKTPGNATGISVVGSLAFAAVEGYGVQIIEVCDHAD